ncbi:alpha/beta fold hydrolase [Haloarcula halophila]|uniref:alpha/beta fold hydrolase n=1 Tax=Haloarcula TaxID=2237 RepID=UPI0023E41A68|nr:alpha/beta hydrolase [Halomicroarcula sp. DFY41]
MRASAAAPDRECDRAAQVSRVPIGGDRHVAYAEYGDPDGTPLLLFHGTPGSRLVGALFDDPANRKSVRVIALDRPGYGRSSVWPDRRLDDTAAFALPVLDDAGVDTATVAGFSGGGPHALALARTRPERVDRVAVVSGAVPPSLQEEPPAVQRFLGVLGNHAGWLLAGAFAVTGRLARVLPPSFVVSQYTTAEGPALSEAEEELVHEEFVAAIERTRSGAVTEAGLLADPWEFDVAAVESPVSLFHGELDTNVPLAAARRLADTIPGAELRVDDTDHLTTLLRARERVLTACTQ